MSAEEAGAIDRYKCPACCAPVNDSGGSSSRNAPWVDIKPAFVSKVGQSRLSEQLIYVEIDVDGFTVSGDTLHAFSEYDDLNKHLHAKGFDQFQYRYQSITKNRARNAAELQQARLEAEDAFQEEMIRLSVGNSGGTTFAVVLFWGGSSEDNVEDMDSKAALNAKVVYCRANLSAAMQPTPVPTAFALYKRTGGSGSGEWAYVDKTVCKVSAPLSDAHELLRVHGITHHRGATISKRQSLLDMTFYEDG